MRNIPIIRCGVIAAMPDEPLRDDNSGFEYNAYLIEARSLGGLSGSPVFVYRVLNRWLHANSVLMPVIESWLIGVVRGHWDYKKPLADFITGELESVNMGIALVTPIQELLNLIRGDETLMKERKRIAKERAKQHAPTLDSGFRSGSAKTTNDLTKKTFEQVLRRVSSKVSESDSGKKGEGG